MSTDPTIPDHECDSGNFDRTICPDPCGVMHSFCARCGERADRCAHDDAPTGAAVDDRAIRAEALRSWPVPLNDESILGGLSEYRHGGRNGFIVGAHWALAAARAEVNPGECSVCTEADEVYADVPRHAGWAEAMRFAHHAHAGETFNGYPSANGVLGFGPDAVIVDGDWLVRIVAERVEARVARAALRERVAAEVVDVRRTDSRIKGGCDSLLRRHVVGALHDAAERVLTNAHAEDEYPPNWLAALAAAPSETETGRAELCTDRKPWCPIETHGHIGGYIVPWFRPTPTDPKEDHRG